MITLQEEIDVSRPATEAFRYISDFTTTAEWDATAFRASKETPGEIAVGTVFKVDCKLPLGSVRITYRVSEFTPDRLIELRGESKLFNVIDRITFEPTQDGTHIVYRADFELRGPLAALQGAMTSGMQRMGRKAVAGMRDALNDDFSAPQARPGTARADDLVLPGLAMFSRFGYHRGRKHWNPVSASVVGKHMVVTGASSGIGLAAARALAEMGAGLTLVMRNPSKAEKVVADLVRETGNTDIRAEIADLALMADVDALVARMVAAKRPIDVLVNNAGALFNPRTETEEGLESSFALLLLSPYRLTLGLKPLLAQAPQARVVNVVSGGLYSQKLEVHKLIARAQNYSGSVAYARAKRALLVVTEQWGEAWEDENIVVNAMHPGWADTPGVETALPGFHRLTRSILRSPEEGADTIVWLAAATEAGATTGELFLDREPRTKHLQAKTQEAAGEREKLQVFLASFNAEH